MDTLVILAASSGPDINDKGAFYIAVAVVIAFLLIVPKKK